MSGRILLAIVIGSLAGIIFQEQAGEWGKPTKLVIIAIKALALPLILFAITHVLMTAQVQGAKVGKLARLLLTNTAMAIGIGLLLANVIQPGVHSPKPAVEAGDSVASGSLLGMLEDSIPKSFLGPLGDQGKPLSVIVIAIVLGLALRTQRQNPAFATVEGLVKLALATLTVILKWVVELLPLAVLGIIASKVGTGSTKQFAALGWFVVTVCAGLLLQSAYYLLRVWRGSWVTPLQMLQGCRDALLTAFSTASSTCTMPITYTSLREKVGLREDSANLGAMVGTNFNNDGTALYEAVAALFVAQMVGISLGLPAQLVIVLTSMLAAMGAAGIPEGGAATLALVLSSVNLPVEYVALLLTVDWFVDRCRTMVNVMGDCAVSCILDGKTRGSEYPAAPI
ncbi:dicarboxylate/amino acid:cation symporter [Prosthecobacter algae]|uniref:dicarboxylate/amino acid:cation symporter n=1 Tax=Prosthecobacter algae TaxID=1144682 RepID=UPI0031ED4198